MCVYETGPPFCSLKRFFQQNKHCDLNQSNVLVPKQ